MRNLRQRWIALVVMLLGMAPGRAVWSGDATVELRLFQFQPTPLEITVGTRVIWLNADDIGHTVTGGEPEQPDGRFAGELAGKGTRFAFTFDQPGRYAYYCDRHHFMRGEIRVTQP